MNYFHTMETNATFTIINWKKKLLESNKQRSRNSFILHQEDNCTCQLRENSVMRIQDTNGRKKKPDSIDEFDLRPLCLTAIENLFDYHRWTFHSTFSISDGTFKLADHGN